jgi:hypothetical protein
MWKKLEDELPTSLEGYRVFLVLESWPGKYLENRAYYEYSPIRYVVNGNYDFCSKRWRLCDGSIAKDVPYWMDIPEFPPLEI